MSIGLATHGQLVLSIACLCALNVVDAAGQPTPGPLKFCKVTAAAFRRASCDAFELSVGNDMVMVGFLTACPAATLAFSDWSINKL